MQKRNPGKIYYIFSASFPVICYLNNKKGYKVGKNDQHWQQNKYEEKEQTMYIFPRFSAQSAEKPENTKYNFIRSNEFFLFLTRVLILNYLGRGWDRGLDTTVLPSYKVSFFNPDFNLIVLNIFYKI